MCCGPVGYCAAVPLVATGNNHTKSLVVKHWVVIRKRRSIRLQEIHGLNGVGTHSPFRCHVFIILWARYSTAWPHIIFSFMWPVGLHRDLYQAGLNTNSTSMAVWWLKHPNPNRKKGKKITIWDVCIWWGQKNNVPHSRGLLVCCSSAFPWSLTRWPASAGSWSHRQATQLSMLPV